MDYIYQHPDTHSMKKLKEWKFTLGQDGTTIENSRGEKRTLDTMFSELITFQEGIYNDSVSTRNWGLYNSTFYNIVMYNVLIKIVSEVETAILLEK